MNQIVGAVEDAVEDVTAAVKPRLRGWLHAGITPVVLIAGIVLVALAPTTPSRLAAAVYAFSGLILFGTSATYHLGNWGERAFAALKRADHSNIYIIIAGSYTPVAALTLDGAKQTYMLVGVWAATIIGILFRIFWHDAPRALYTALYVALGWSVLPFTIDLFRANVAAASLILAGGILYTIGGVIYGIKRPNPHPTWFGFHEVFHAFTIAAWACHYIAISVLTYQQ
jgi:hemolysin III